MNFGTIQITNIFVGALNATEAYFGTEKVWGGSEPPTNPLTKVKYTAASGLPDWEGDITGELTSSSIPNKSSIAEVEIGSNVTSIGIYALQDCSGLTSVTIPDSVTSIGDSAFRGCSGLTSITIGDNVTSIGVSAFRGCGGLTSVTIPSSVTSIGSTAFRDCTGLTSATFSGKDKATVQGMANYSWRLPSGCVIHCTDGDITL